MFLSRKCVYGLRAALYVAQYGNDANPCPLHDEWTYSCQTLKGNLANTTVNDLVLKIKESNLRISGG